MSLRALAVVVLAAWMAGCGASQDPEVAASGSNAISQDGANSQAAYALLHDNRLDIPDEPTTRAMTVASTRPGVAAWQWTLFDEGLVIRGLKDVQQEGETTPDNIVNGVGISLHVDDSGVVSIDGLAVLDEVSDLNEIKSLIYDAKSDFDAARANVPEMDDVNVPTASTAAKAGCIYMAVVQSVLVAEASGWLIMGGVSACATLLGCIVGAPMVVIGVVGIAGSVVQAVDQTDTCVRQ
jgi:hypothetical protein